MASVDHPNVVKYFGFVQDEIFWVVMEYCSKGSLLEILKGSKPPPDKLNTVLV